MYGNVLQRYFVARSRNNFCPVKATIPSLLIDFRVVVAVQNVKNFIQCFRVHTTMGSLRIVVELKEYFVLLLTLIRIKYSVCVCVCVCVYILAIRHKMRMRRIILSSVALNFLEST